MRRRRRERDVRGREKNRKSKNGEKTCERNGERLCRKENNKNPVKGLFKNVRKMVRVKRVKPFFFFLFLEIYFNTTPLDFLFCSNPVVGFIPIKKV